MYYDAIYARQSVDKQDSISIESQFSMCEHETRGNDFKKYGEIETLSLRQ